jgi:hypothetical protein
VAVSSLSVLLSAGERKIVRAKLMSAKKHAEVPPCKKRAVVLGAATQTAKRNATKILPAKRMHAKTRVEVIKRLVVVLTLNLNVGSPHVRWSARKILLAKKVPFAEIYV